MRTQRIIDLADHAEWLELYIVDPLTGCIEYVTGDGWAEMTAGNERCRWKVARDLEGARGIAEKWRTN